MKSLLIVIASITALSGCAVVPYGPPGAYGYGPTVVVPIGGYYGYRGGYGRGYR